MELDGEEVPSPGQVSPSYPGLPLCFSLKPGTCLLLPCPLAHIGPSVWPLPSPTLTSLSSRHLTLALTIAVVTIFVNFMFSEGLQNYTNLQHNFLHMGPTPLSPVTQCVKNHPIW